MILLLLPSLKLNRNHFCEESVETVPNGFPAQRIEAEPIPWWFRTDSLSILMICPFVKNWDNYLYVIIKVRNDLRAIEILKSSLVPSLEVSFTYVPLSLVFLITASGKDDFTLSYRMHQNFHSFLRCHCDILWFKKLHFFLCTIMKKIMVTACTCACEKH